MWSGYGQSICRYLKKNVILKASLGRRSLLKLGSKSYGEACRQADAAEQVNKRRPWEACLSSAPACENGALFGLVLL